MPELPDVENFKVYFRRNGLNKKITAIECSTPSLIKEVRFSDFKKKLMEKKFKDVRRRGKFLIIDIARIPEKLIIHFGMTGGLSYAEQDTERKGRDRFSRLIFKFDNNEELRWLNVRKLGKIYLKKDPESVELIKELGPEPLQISERQFFELLRKCQNKNIKAFLLDQRNIAGIGNIYSDEILFRAKINPHRIIETLSKIEKQNLYQGTINALREAIEIRPSYGMYGIRFETDWLLSHRHKDMECPRNKNHKLKREIIAGRAAIYCPICQK
ncbi:Fpg/Nei family DNA glycosylase [Candidatus Parcubacteria bacterium]|nr:Fpg/Nei family DNA glycosylase [Candidatus Parcubacteria bacterium]